MAPHPQIIEKDGKKEFAVLPYDEFLKIQEALEGFEDLTNSAGSHLTAAPVGRGC